MKMVKSRGFGSVLLLCITIFSSFPLSDSFKIAFMEFLEETRQEQNEQINRFIGEGKCKAFGYELEGIQLSDVFTCGFVQLYNHFCAKILVGLQKPYIESRRMYNVATADYENEAERLNAIINEFAESAQRGFGSHATFMARFLLIIAKIFLLGIKAFIRVTLDLILPLSV